MPSLAKKNNNPGNIIFLQKTTWLGQIGKDSASPFIQFSELKYGTRALLLLLIKYISVKKLNTIQSIINRWSATDQQAYINFVSKQTGFSITQTLEAKAETLKKLATAISKFESGGDLVLSDSELEEGLILTNITPTDSITRNFIWLLIPLLISVYLVYSSKKQKA